MLLKLIFIFSLNLGVFTVHAEGETETPTQEEEERMNSATKAPWMAEASTQEEEERMNSATKAPWMAEASTQEEKERANYEKLMREREALLERAKNKWHSCRANCIATCKERCPVAGSAQSIYVGGGLIFTPDEPFSSHSEQTCLASCTNNKCDIEFCSSEKAKYEDLKQKLEDMNSAQKEYDESKDEKVSNSPLQQVQKKKKDTNLLAWVGVGTTAYLFNKCRVCYAGCSHGCHARCAHWCVMGGAAGWQTKKMFDKENELGETAQTMCTSTNDPSCKDYNDDSNNDDDLNIPEVPGCESGSCDTIIQIVDPPPGECPPDEPNCKTKIPTIPDGSPRDFSSFTADQIEKLEELFRPKGGWPDGKSPFSELETESFDYDKLTPAQKKQVNQALAGFNEKKQAFLDKHGLTGSSSDGDGAGDDSDETSGATGLNNSDGVSAKFNGMADGSRSLAGSEDNIGQRGSAKLPANSIADQIQNMLKKTRGMADGSKKNGSGFLGDKSVLIGDDNVGVREDNIFMIVHRMNRKLDYEERFIKTVSF